MKKLLSCIVLAATIFSPLRASAELAARICTRKPNSSVTLRIRPGINQPSGLVMVGSGGVAVDNYFRQRGYTVQDGERISVSSRAEGTDNRVWYKVGTNQWVAWVRSDFVCQNDEDNP